MDSIVVWYFQEFQIRLFIIEVFFIDSFLIHGIGSMHT